MDGDQFREAVEDAKATELDRYGSSKLLVALTDAELDRESVLAVAANSERAARTTFEAWAADEEDAAAAAAFEEVAAREADHYDRVIALLPDGFDPVDGGVMHAYLRGREETIPRVAGGMVGRCLVSTRAHAQIVSFFVNEADESTADLFRDLRADTEAVVEDGCTLLDDLCESAEEWEAARGSAEYVIQLAYDDYADALTELGLDVKNVC